MWEHRKLPSPKPFGKAKLEPHSSPSMCNIDLMAGTAVLLRSRLVGTPSRIAGAGASLAGKKCGFFWIRWHWQSCWFHHIIGVEVLACGHALNIAVRGSEATATIGAKLNDLLPDISPRMVPILPGLLQCVGLHSKLQKRRHWPPHTLQLRSQTFLSNMT